MYMCGDKRMYTRPETLTSKTLNSNSEPQTSNHYRRDYAKADGIRDDLSVSFGIVIDDDMREWRVAGSSGSNMRVRARGGEERSGGGARRGKGRWTRAPFDNAEVDEEKVMQLVQVGSVED